MTDSDREWMAQALALGAVAEGTTSPNPRVGCLVVAQGQVVGRGFHRAAGQPHAEVLAVEQAGTLARGATAFVNLEPCAHQGRTPPCTDLLIDAGVRRVVAAMQDPHSLVNGRGFERLRQAGVEVQVGLLEDQAQRLNEGFCHFHRHGIPWVTLKAAVSLDGKLAAADGHSQWISGEASRRFAHRLRLRHEAVLVGAGTVRRDDPRLTVRLPGVLAPRHRVVLSRRLELDPDARLFRDRVEGAPPVKIYTAKDVAADRRELFASRAEVRCVPGSPAGLDLRAVLRDLGQLGVQSLLVEGGGKIHGSFMREGLAQRMVLFQADRLLGCRGSTPMADLDAVAEPALGLRLAVDRRIALGTDLMVSGLLPSGSQPAGPDGKPPCSPV